MQGKLKHLCTNKNGSALLCCKNYIHHGASNQERLLVNSMKSIISNHFNHLTNCISESMSSRNCHWKMYGEINKTTKSFDYAPSSLIQKLRSDLMFHEILVHTQMFSGYVETELKLANASLFIVDWLTYKWLKRQRRDLFPAARFNSNRRDVYYLKKLEKQQSDMSYLKKLERQQSEMSFLSKQSSTSNTTSVRTCNRGSYPDQHLFLNESLGQSRLA